MLGLGLSLLTGGALRPYYAVVAAAFKDRVEADGGTVESMSCLKADLKVLNPIKPPAFTGLLNDYSGAAAAYSLRLLDNTYTGNAIKVRRSSDNAEQDIAFVNNELDTASLETFAGAGDAFVTTWYDQSGNGSNATQATASIQPQIVLSGSTILDNGKPAIQFNEDEMVSTRNGTTDNYAQPNTYFIAANASGGVTDFTDGGGSARNLNDYSSSKHRMFANFSLVSTFVFTGLQFLRYSLFNQTNSEISINGATIQTGNVGDAAMNSDFTIGDNGSYFKMKEFVMYNSNESSNRTGIETNINDFYTIY